MQDRFAIIHSHQPYGITVKPHIMTTVNNNSINNINNANDLIGALVTYNSDPYLIEDEAQAQEVFDSIESNGLELIANPTNEDLEKLNLTAYNKVKALYSFGEGLICLDGDWEM